MAVLEAAPYKQRYYPQSGYYPSAYYGAGAGYGVDDYYGGGYSPYASTYPYHYGGYNSNRRAPFAAYQAAYPSAYPSAYPGFGWPSRWSPFSRFGPAQVNI